jgi:hypothetical protein
MLQNLSANVRECQLRAEACRRKAELATDRMIQDHWLDMETRWLKLAASYEFCEQLSRYVRQHSSRAD